MSTPCSRPRQDALMEHGTVRAVQGGNGISLGHATGALAHREIARDLAGVPHWGRGARRTKLPDFGSPADMALSKSREVSSATASCCSSQRRRGHRRPPAHRIHQLARLQIASSANNGDYKFHFFFVKDDEINAFALPGGYVGVNSGLILASEQRERARRSARARGIPRDAAAHRALDVRQPAHEHHVDGRDARRAPARCGGQFGGRRA